MPPTQPADYVTQLVQLTGSLVAQRVPLVPPPGKMVARSMLFGYAVRDQDLELVTAAVEGSLVGAIALYGKPDASNFSAYAGVCAIAIKALLKARAKGAMLDPLQVRVVSALKSRPEPWGLSELCESINAAQDEAAPPWTEQEIADGLESLLQVMTRTGNVEFVACSHHGLWSSLV